jgi:enterochelin esterase-like enzyme
LGLTHPGTFCSITSHSGAVLVPLYHGKERKKDPEKHAEFDAIFGKKAAGGPNDCLALARKCPKNLRPALRLDCGADDFLLPQNRFYHLQLKRMGFPHIYDEYPGDHNWAYWDAHIMEAVRFHCAALGIASSAP